MSQSELVCNMGGQGEAHDLCRAFLLFMRFRVQMERDFAILVHPEGAAY
jgi:hypothetical protein